jgi:hypothetical protein
VSGALACSSSVRDDEMIEAGSYRVVGDGFAFAWSTRS